jgi:hypothetical protein
MQRIRTLAIVALLSAATAAAQVPDASQSKSGFPIDVSAKPSTVRVGGTVTLKGNTVSTPSQSTVTLTITPPTGAPFSLTTKAASDGAFSSTFNGTKTIGQYRVDAVAPDGQGRASTTFTVGATGEVPAAIAEEMQRLIAAVDQALDVARDGLAAQPLSPAKQQAEQKLATAAAEVAKAPAQVAVFKQQMTKVFAAREKIRAPMPEWDKYEEQLDSWKDDAEVARKRLEQQAQATRTAAQGCAQLDQYYEMLNSASDALDLAKAPLDLSVGFWQSKAISGVVTRTTDPRLYSTADVYAYTTALKLAVAALQGPVAFMAAIPGFILDAAKYMYQARFGDYCEKFEGPVKGQFVGESLTRTGEFWFSQIIALDGKMVLMHPKNAPANKPIAVEGYIEGNGRFQVRENPNVIGRLIPGTALFHTVRAPAGLPYANDFSQGLKGIAPNYFRVPIRGILAGDSIVLSMPMQPAIKDFGATIQGRLIWVVIPLGGMIPEILDSPFDFQKAHPIIERVVRRNPVLKLRTSQKFVIAENEFARDTTSADRTAHVTTTLTLRACRPGCLPAGAFKGVQ